MTCSADTSLAEATSLMDRRQIGSVVVTERSAILGILTERDLLRAAAERVDAANEPVRRWMTSEPDVLGQDDEVGVAWSGLTHHHYRHLPVVDGDELVGMVSIRDLLTVAQIRPAGEIGTETPRGLEGVVVAQTSVGDVRGQEGFFHYRQYSADGAGRPAVVRGRLAAAVRRQAARPTEAGRFAEETASLAPASRGRASDSCPRWPRTAPRSTPCAPASRPSVPSSDGGRATTSATRSCGPRRCGCARRSPPCSPPSTASDRATSPCDLVPTSPSPPTTCGC